MNWKLYFEKNHLSLIMLAILESGCFLGISNFILSTGFLFVAFLSVFVSIRQFQGKW